MKSINKHNETNLNLNTFNIIRYLQTLICLADWSIVLGADIAAVNQDVSFIAFGGFGKSMPNISLFIYLEILMSKAAKKASAFIDETISVCLAKDIDVLTVSAKKITQNIYATNYA